jgi:hypothetical protein
MSLADFSKSVLESYSKVITNQIFLLIQNDKDMMQDYLKAVEENGSDVVNRHLGKAIKIRFGLENDESRELNPSSTLIKSHQQFQ